MKREVQEQIGWCIKKHLRGVQFTEPVNFVYEWHEKNCMRDKDNIAFAKKFIQDALVQYGVLKNDGWGEVADFSDQFFVDKHNARIVVRMWIAREGGIKIAGNERCPLCGALKE